VRVGVLASGSGTNLRAILERGIPVVVVLADRPCAALDVAREAGIAVELVERDDYTAAFDRLAYTHRVVDALVAHGVELIAMAGFGTILEKPIHDAFPNRILNTHPALLPAFKGWHAVADALAAGVKITGCTVHLARLEVDDGPILAQEAVPVLEGDTVESLHERIKEVERRLYPEVIAEVVADYDKSQERGE
jgi:phosphoribosylglycinamide formyltransferase-1